MAGDGAHFDEDDQPIRRSPWLPPDDRLWRHPSEVGSLAARATSGYRRLTARGWVRSAGRFWAVTILAGGLGAGLTAAVLAATGSLNPLRTAAGNAAAGGHPPGAVTATLASPTGAQPTTTPASAKGGAIGAVSLSPALMAMIERVLPSVVAVEASGPGAQRRGTGLVFEPDGMVLTAEELVTGASEIHVTTASGQQVAASVVGTDPSTGVSVLQAADGDLVPLALNPPGQVRVGELTVAVTMDGAPGEPPDASVGLVEALGDTAVTLPGGQSLDDAVETDSPPADAAGGILLDATGNLVGMTEGTIQGKATELCVSESGALVHLSATQLASTTTSAHGWLGVQGSDLPPQRAHSLGLAGGAMVVAVQPSSPAAQAGMRPGDVVSALDAQPVTSMADLQRLVWSLPPGSIVELDLLRGNVPLHLQTRLGG